MCTFYESVFRRYHIFRAFASLFVILLQCQLANHFLVEDLILCSSVRYLDHESKRSVGHLSILIFRISTTLKTAKTHATANTQSFQVHLYVLAWVVLVQVAPHDLSQFDLCSTNSFTISNHFAFWSGLQNVQKMCCLFLWFIM